VLQLLLVNRCANGNMCHYVGDGMTKGRKLIVFWCDIMTFRHLLGYTNNGLEDFRADRWIWYYQQIE